MRESFSAISQLERASPDIRLAAARAIVIWYAVLDVRSKKVVLHSEGSETKRVLDGLDKRVMFEHVLRMYQQSASESELVWMWNNFPV